MRAFATSCRMRRRILDLSSIALGCGIAMTASAQPTAMDSSRAPGVVLLRQVAEAVDGTRVGGLVWVVVQHVPPQQVVGVVHTDSAARVLLQRAPRSYSVLGPYRAPALDDGFIVGCQHIIGSAMVGYCPAPIRWAAIDSLSLRIRMRDGSVRITPIPLNVDAVFLRWSAIDKFVVPYYTRILGVDSAAAMRRAMETGPAPRPEPARPPL